MKATALEAPFAVVMITWAGDEPLSGGTVTEQVFAAGQLVDAT